MNSKIKSHHDKKIKNMLKNAPFHLEAVQRATHVHANKKVAHEVIH